MLEPASMSGIGFFGPGIGGGELLLVLAAALLLFGSKRLPGIARSLGKTIEEWQRAARSIRDELLSPPPDETNTPLPSHDPDRTRPTAGACREAPPTEEPPQVKGDPYDHAG